MAELADAQDLKSCGWRHSYRFDSGCRHKKHMSCVIALHVLFTNIRRKQNPAMLRILVCLICGYGEIGRRAGFRFQWVIPCRFESCYPHETKNPNQNSANGSLIRIFFSCRLCLKTALFYQRVYCIKSKPCFRGNIAVATVRSCRKYGSEKKR